MKCTQCQHEETKVIESRDVAEGASIRRRRECAKCSHRFTSYERIEKPQLIVVKKDGTRELFNRQKLLAGLYRATEKTPVTSLELEKLVDRVETNLLACGDGEVGSSKIGDEVMDELSNLNEVAYVRFASVYKRFKDIASFERELSEMRQRKKQKLISPD
ncbi:transcriptional repressor NrdR [Candidatus Saccharibacteria bacterium]|jgi:transcriptional repressor NrdR|nr:MAG: transcriptional repressor NrdR [Candidatus Saccharibacteria bacterium]